jgi:tRNA pseudouridine55 synthase
MARRRRGRPVHGWFALDKPAGITATAATGAVRRIFDAEKAGHAGTLDPLATGVLPIALGEATKTVPYVVDGRKLYRFEIRWGEARDTDDAEGAVIAESAIRPEEAAVRAILPRFCGAIRQRPPAYSAIKVAGERAYDLARAGQEIALEERVVAIYRIDLTDYIDRDRAAFEVECGKGCYVRSLARDLAVALGTLGHVTRLRRECVGPFAAADAIPLAKLEHIRHNINQGGLGSSEPAQTLLALLRPIETALDDIPALALTGSEADRIRHGRPMPVLRSDNRKVVDALEPGATVFARCEGKPIGLLCWDGAIAHPLRLFNL